MRFRNWSIFFMLGFSLLVSAEKSHSLEIVKISSQDPSGMNDMVGSGVGLKGIPFIITSDHVFFHSNAGYLHRRKSAGDVYHGSLGNYLVADWGKGLGLFYSGASHRGSTEDTGFCKQAHPARTEFQAYPSESNEPVMSVAHFSEQISAEDYFVQNKVLDVYRGGLAEFGMSGGAVIDPDHHCLAGIISHQRRLKQGETETLVIPASEIESWVQAHLNAYETEQKKTAAPYGTYTDHLSTFFEEVSSQLGLQKSVIMGDIRFYLYPIPHDEITTGAIDVLATVDDRSHPGETMVVPMSSASKETEYSPEAEKAAQKRLSEAGVRSIAIANEMISLIPGAEQPLSIWMVPLFKRVTDHELSDESRNLTHLTDYFREHCSYQVPQIQRKILRVTGWKKEQSERSFKLSKPGLVHFFRDLQKKDLQPVTAFAIENRTH